MSTQIQRPAPGILRLTKSRPGAALYVGFFVLFFAGWYSILEDIAAIAENLADMLGVEVSRKGSGKKSTVGFGRD